jgi:hypothetical protein
MPKKCIYRLCMILEINSDYFPKLHEDEACFLSGKS